MAGEGLNKRGAEMTESYRANEIMLTMNRDWQECRGCKEKGKAMRSNCKGETKGI